MFERALVHEPCRRAEKIGGLAQVLQRGAPARRNRPKDADQRAKSRWRNQPATVTKPEKSNLRRSKLRPHCTSCPRAVPIGRCGPFAAIPCASPQALDAYQADPTLT